MGKPATDGVALVQVHVKEDVLDWLAAKADREGITRSDYVRRHLYSLFTRDQYATPAKEFKELIATAREKRLAKQKRRARRAA